MFKLNFKIAFRNLWKTRGFSLLNIFGLSVGLTGFIMILMYASYEKSYDSWNPKAENIYSLSIRWAPGEDIYSSSPAELAPALKNVLPEIEDYGRYYVWDMKQRLLARNRNEGYVDHIMGVDSNWFQLFPYKFIYGNAKTALQASNQIVLSSKVSKKFFGDLNPVGQTLTINAKNSYLVSGVFQEPSTPEHLDFDGFIKKSSAGDGWGNGNFYTYLLIKKGVDKNVLKEKINKAFKTLPILKQEKWLATAEIFLTPVKDIYLYGKSVQSPAKRGNSAIITLLTLFSGLLLVIACINFTNLSIAQSVKRAKETGVRKVLGAKKSQLITYFLTSTTIQCLISLAISLVLIEVFMPVLNNLMDTHLSLFTYTSPLKLTTQITVAMFFVILLSGGYSAFFLSSYEPVKVLKGNLSRGVNNLWLRKSLIMFQFAVATIFIISLIIIKQQVNFIQNKDLGFNKDQVLVFQIRTKEARQNFEQFKQRISKINGVKAISRVNYYPGVKEMQVIGREFNGKSVQNLSLITTDFDYFEVMKIPAQKGRVFSKQFVTDTSGIVVNESAFKKYQLQTQIGHTWIDGRTLLGVVKDHVQKGMETMAEPTAYVIEGQHTNAANRVIIKITDSNVQQTLNAIKNVWEEAEPFPFQYTWLDESFAKVYVQYVRLDELFNIFTYVTVFIALLGLFSLASFVIYERKKEISIRKVLGAETINILAMLNRSFLVIVIIANIIAIPVSYILANQWLSGFAFRVQITPWPFIIAGLFSLLITSITVSLQAYKTAKAAPINGLKYE
ncbi:FtsX-like permease family protein [Pedobacter sp. Du54]|uniref:ABC transporter permease n=1 Tax=Pedobacter anseongensis TaxID=3133439 RepID=UPI0030A72931